MTYQEATEYLFNAAPLFQQVGGEAYKEGLYNTTVLDAHYGHPHRSFRTLHVAGTNGKGSCSHTLAAILQECGYKVGLYTSPHLLDFRERIRVNGQLMDEQYVIDFVEEERQFFEPLHPSFFELTTALAFRYFAAQRVDIAVIEVGLGGRLDCTNIISPELSIITNISFDHVQFLGNTLEKIATEKGGIIKPNTPVVIGEHTDETLKIFKQIASEKGAPITFAQEEKIVTLSYPAECGRNYQTTTLGTLWGELGGACQEKNSNTILHAVEQLRKLDYPITDEHVRHAFAHVNHLTGLAGRWQQLGTSPKIICDTAHNEAGIHYVVNQLEETPYTHLHIVLGMVNDKDTRKVLSMLPKNATYYFTQAQVKRALPPEELKKQASTFSLKGDDYPSVKQAFDAAKNKATEKDLIFIGGSNFIVADLLTLV